MIYIYPNLKSYGLEVRCGSGAWRGDALEPVGKLSGSSAEILGRCSHLAFTLCCGSMNKLEVLLLRTVIQLGREDMTSFLSSCHSTRQKKHYVQ